MIFKLISDFVFLKKNIAIFISVFIYSSSIVAQVSNDSLRAVENRGLLFCSIPFGNSIYFNSDEIQNELKGFLYGTLGFKQYYSKNDAVTLNIGLVTLFPTPLPAASYCESCDSALSFFATLKRETDLLDNRLCLGFGASLASYWYNQSDYVYDEFDIKPDVDSVYNTTTFIRNGLGVSLSGYYNFKEIFGMENKIDLKLGVNYIPTFYNPHSDIFRYYHTLFIDVRFDLDFFH